MRPVLAFLLLTLAACTSQQADTNARRFLEGWRPPVSCFTNAIGQTLCQ